METTLTFLHPKRYGNFKQPRKRTNRKRDYRDGNCPAYLAKIRKLPSCVSRARPCEAHHLRKKDERGVGMRATDRWALPLTHDEHLGKDGVHSVVAALEREWFANRGVDCYDLAARLWAARASLDKMRDVLDRAWEKGDHD